MGIKGLTKLLADNAPKAMKEQKFESYFGRKIAIDASMSIYQFLIVVGRIGTETLTNEAGEVTSHLQGMFTRTIRLLEAGMKPVFVFDGQPPDLKKQELAKRYSKREDATKDLNAAIETGDKDGIEKFSKRTVKVTKQHNEDCKNLLRLMGVPVIEAPSEAEAECASLCKNGKVYAVASEDMDSLTFGAPRFLRHLMEPSSKKIAVMEFEVAKVLEELQLTMDQFIDLCILCGCDYCDSIKGIGGQTALKLIRQHGSIETMLENINRDRYQIPEDWPYQEARRLFKEPLVCNDAEELKWTPPDEEGLVNFLVNENGFNNDRIVKSIEKIKAAKNKSSQGRLESFFKPVVSTSVPLKRKLSSDSSTQDEIDFEFLGHIRGDMYRLQTNIFTQGKGDREQRFHLWFDPTQDFHTYTILWNPIQVIMYVDDIPVRLFKKNESLAVNYPEKQPMKVHASLWNGEDWATEGGTIKIDWSKAPFVAYYRDYSTSACVWSDSGSISSCANDTSSWMNQGLDAREAGKMSWAKKNYMIYDYCDKQGSDDSIRRECSREFS